MQSIEKLKFLTAEQVRNLAKEYGTPIFVYSQAELERKCDEALAFPNAYGLTLRYAMKANPNANILKIIRKKGIQIDASSGYEVHRALLAGFTTAEIQLTSQEEPKDLKELIEKGVYFNACSLKQLENFGKMFPGHKVSLRFNPGLGSGHTKKTDVGGTTSAFGIWHEKTIELKAIIEKYKLIVEKVHTHIGSGSDPEVWKAVAHYTLEYAELFPTCKIVNLGGGFKVGRMEDEKSTDNTGCILASIDDKIDTGAQGFTFLKLDTGMDANTRPSLYGSRHPMVVVSKEESAEPSQSSTKEYVVVGHCCESGDVFTQKEGGEPIVREMQEAAIGDYVVMEGSGAYCSSMSTKNYNSFPETAEVLIDMKGNSHLIRRRQSLEQILQNEILL